jgi:anaerobic selenocysteine-containing dehydrogenase
MPSDGASGSWHKTACILCECNCGIEVKLGGADGRRFETIRGDRDHPASRGYACEKAHRLDFYQNGPHRLTAPLRRRDDGTFEEIDWDTAIREVALRIHPGDALRLGLSDDGRARLTTRRASVEVHVEVSDRVQPGHVALPNGLGVDYVDGGGAGVAPNELTGCEDRDWLAGTPWHKHVPARVEALA